MTHPNSNGNASSIRAIDDSAWVFAPVFERDRSIAENRSRVREKRF